MIESIKYGQTGSEKLAEEKQQCRQIVSEISKFGISQNQSMFIMYLLALELENVEHLQLITSLIRELSGEDLFLIDKGEK